MINLIPQKAKKRLLLEYWVRVSSVWLLLWGAALFAAAAVIFPAYVLISTQTSVLEASSAAISEKVASYESVTEQLELANQLARSVLEEASAPLLSEYVLLFQELQGEAIQVTRITVGLDEAGVAPARIEGLADDRQSLASYRDRLMDSDQVATVNLPISNLAQDKDIPFSVTVELVANEVSI